MKRLRILDIQVTHGFTNEVFRVWAFTKTGLRRAVREGIQRSFQQSFKLNNPTF